jgi:hypothetical protein
MLELVGIHVRYGNIRALRGVSCGSIMASSSRSSVRTARQEHDAPRHLPASSARPMASSPFETEDITTASTDRMSGSGSRIAPKDAGSSEG